LDYQSDFCLTR